MRHTCIFINIFIDVNHLTIKHGYNEKSHVFRSLSCQAMFTNWLYTQNIILTSIVRRSKRTKTRTRFLETSWKLKPLPGCETFSQSGYRSKTTTFNGTSSGAVGGLEHHISRAAIVVSRQWDAVYNMFEWFFMCVGWCDPHFFPTFPWFQQQFQGRSQMV